MRIKEIKNLLCYTLSNDITVHRRRNIFYSEGAKTCFQLSQVHNQPRSDLRSFYAYCAVQSILKL